MRKSRMLAFALDYTVLAVVAFAAAALIPFKDIGFDPRSIEGRLVVATIGLALIYAMYWRHFISKRNS